MTSGVWQRSFWNACNKGRRVDRGSMQLCYTATGRNSCGHRTQMLLVACHSLVAPKVQVLNPPLLQIQKRLLNQTTEDWYTCLVTLSATKGLSERCFASLSMIGSR